MEKVTFPGRRPLSFALLLAGVAIGAVVLSAVVVPHAGVLVGGRLALVLVVVVSAAAGIGGVRVGIIAGVLATAVLFLAELALSGAPSAAESVDLLVDLGVFLGVALIQGIQTGELRDSARVSVQREHEATLLARLGAQLVPDSPLALVLEGARGDLHEVLGARTVTVFITDEKGELGVLRAEAAQEVERDPQMLEIAKWVASNSTSVGPLEPGAPLDEGTGHLKMVAHSEVSTDARRQDVFVPMVSMSAPEGVLRVAPLEQSHKLARREFATIEFVAGLLATFRERQRLREIVSRSESLKEADLVKSAIVSSFSHELKTPLASATTAVASLLDPENRAMGVGDEAREELEGVAQDLQRLRGHIDRLLEFSRLEASQWTPKMEWNDITDVCAIVRSAFPKEARDKIEFSFAEDTPCLRFDFAQMARALHHVVENALTYAGPQAHVILGTEPSESGGVRVWVEDNGPGVADDEKDAIFTRFRRGRASEKEPGGTGLGLSIARDIVDIHGARIWVEDVDPHGARFVIELPPDQAEGANT